MKTLPKNWIAEGLIDFEYKKYQLLSYLQSTDQQFDASKLYPVLGELIDHHRNLDDLKKGKSNLKNLFPKALTGIDFEKGKLNYAAKEPEGDLMQEIANITDFALPMLANQIQKGKEIYQYVETQIAFEPVGIMPIYTKEGFLLLSKEYSNEILAFRYQSNLLQMAGERFRSIRMWLVGVFQKTIINTLEKIKLQLIKDIQELPNPATWRLHCHHDFPLEETLLPVSKRLLLQHVSNSDA
ncbi:hypothetical protein [Algoriphagus machipongonensis]|uniref:Uncharacterized protein n=1 Tax=Algoriphagus machipongonensis TaxID=388413 RepID=A3I099_9BACT|nr:hypothetical protein [Algoriphagus machipongonensis]EAZ79895.1 hypothetical protein ALPR1_14739 [Algoriphagus machipongonensis]